MQADGAITFFRPQGVKALLPNTTALHPSLPSPFAQSFDSVFNLFPGFYGYFPKWVLPLQPLLKLVTERTTSVNSETKHRDNAKL